MKAKKHILLLVGIELGLFLLILVVIVIMQSQGRVYTQTPIVFQDRSIVTYIVGDAQFSTDKNIWKDIYIGETISEGMSIRTGSNSRLDIRFSDNSGIRLEENTNIHVNNLNVRQTEFFIGSGTVFSRFTRRFIDQQFRIRSETATAGIRGTSFSFSAEGQTSKVAVYSGLVEFSANNHPDSPVIIYPGAYSFVRTNRIPEQPRMLDNEDFRELELKVRNIQQEQVLYISMTIQFEANTDKFLSESIPELEFVLNELKKHRHSIRIDGHTADIGTESAMENLSRQRAIRIRDYLVENDIPERRLQVAGFGASKPIANNNSSEGRALNRRVEFIIID